MVLERPSIMTRARLALARRRDRRTARREARALFRARPVDAAAAAEADRLAEIRFDAAILVCFGAAVVAAALA